ncbi:hypothetical protein ACFC1B_03660 [Streptomyces xiamenensis]
MEIQNFKQLRVSVLTVLALCQTADGDAKTIGAHQPLIEQRRRGS